MALIIVDFQPGFVRKKHLSLIPPIQREVRKSRSRNELIILLQYEGHGDTLPEITNLLDRYPYKEVVWKCGDDGGIELIDRLFEIDCQPKRFRICGIHSKFCVRSTVETLSSLKPNSDIVLLEDCIGCVKGLNLSWSRLLPNARILECQLIA